MDELSLLKEIEDILRNNDNILKVLVTDQSCKCSHPKSKWVFRNPDCFKINVALEKLNQLRRNK